ncbi:hypothetical protein SAMN05216249_10191 [Acetitomaculum ruminis DSM 5522]|uniref:ATPase domain-containing protein n=1 Tax=Acetitomaculum ruminis DSM 5522 TaxID=1120918 RepID=A0A1I0V0L1_9FIRM|nr:ATP-binding protein [Acetitomaculum ruminis]SFA69855.1 hypothetical protein SAMN05216249_10191 [Acetitomaculum ruminis DSM 5522]
MDKNIKNFIESSNLMNFQNLLGRKKELNQLECWLMDSKKRCIFITGKEGFGKTSLIKSFSLSHKDNLDGIIYSHHSKNIKSIIRDDEIINIHGVKKISEENDREYFKRKSTVLKKILNEKKVLLIIDDYEGDFDDELKLLIEFGFKTVIISKDISTDDQEEILKIGALDDINDLLSLYAYNNNKSISQTEKPYVENIINSLKGHSLLISLMAKQINLSHITLEEAADIAMENELDLEDPLLFMETTGRIIDKMFKISRLSKNAMAVLKVISLFYLDGADSKLIMEALNLENEKELLLLEKNGFLEIEDNKLMLHPLILENIRNREWKDFYYEKATDLMTFLYYGIFNNNPVLKYPELLCSLEFKGFENDNLFSKIKVNTVKGLEIVADTVYDRLGQNKLFKGKLSNNNNKYIDKIDEESLNKYIDLAKTVLDISGRYEEKFVHQGIFGNLLYIVLLNTKDSEFIIDGVNEIFKDVAYCNPIAVMVLFDKLLECYLHKGDLINAVKTIDRAADYVDVHPSHHVLGMYFYLEAKYYDKVISDDYSGGLENGYILEALYNNDLAIVHMEKSFETGAKELLLEYYLDKATTLIKANANSKSGQREIKRLLARSSRIVKNYIEPYSEMRYVYRLTMALYYTYIDKNVEKVHTFAKKAKELALKLYSKDLDVIDKVFLTSAKIMLECGDIVRCLDNIDKALTCCDKHKDIELYNKKWEKLLEYKESVIATIRGQG